MKELTLDHSQQSVVEDRDRLRYPEAQLDSPQMLTNAIGGNKQLELEHCWYQLQSGDTFLLCTDGLNKEVNDDEICSAMVESSTCEKTLETLTRLYQQRGARDNVGMVTVREAS